MEKTNHEPETFLCPVGRFFSELGRKTGKGSDFQEHFNRSRIEFLKAVRSLVDARIDRMEHPEKEDERKATRVEVE
mgnify:CR=1 FL=1